MLSVFCGFSFFYTFYWIFNVRVELILLILFALMETENKSDRLETC